MKRKNHLMFYLTLLICAIMPLGFASFDILAGETSQAKPTLEDSVTKVCYNDTTNKYYTTIEMALKEANSGETIYVIPNPDGVSIYNDCVIKEGVTLNLPYSITYDASTKTYSNPISFASTYGGVTTLSYNDNSRKSILYIEEGVTLTNNGTLYIGGIQSGGNGGSYYSGHTQESFSEINVKKNASIVSNGTITSYGYISGVTETNGETGEIYSTSNLIFNKTSLTEIPFIVVEHRGGSVFMGMAGSDTNDIKNIILTLITSDTTEANLVTSPFNRFFFHNLLNINYTFYSGSILIGKADMYADGQNNKADVRLFDFNNDSSFISFNNNNSLVSGWVNSTTNKNSVNFYGDFSLNSLSISLYVDKAGGIIKGNIYMSTSNIYFPISHYFDISLNPFKDNQNSTINLLNQKIKLLPGCNFIINHGVTVNADSIIVYKNSDFYQNGIYYVTGNVGCSFPYPSTTDAFLLCNGILNTNSFGGLVQTTFLNNASSSINIYNQNYVINKEIYSTYNAVLNVSLTSQSYDAAEYKSINRIAEANIVSLNDPSIKNLSTNTPYKTVIINGNFVYYSYTINFVNTSNDDINFNNYIINNSNYPYFDPNLSSSLVPLTVQKKSDAFEDIKFVGFYLDQNCTVSVSSIGMDVLDKLINDSLYIYCKWQFNKTGITVIINDESGNEISNKYYDDNKVNIQLPNDDITNSTSWSGNYNTDNVISRIEYTFTGWSVYDYTTGILLETLTIVDDYDINALPGSILVLMPNFTSNVSNFYKIDMSFSKVTVGLMFTCSTTATIIASNAITSGMVQNEYKLVNVNLKDDNINTFIFIEENNSITINYSGDSNFLGNSAKITIDFDGFINGNTTIGPTADKNQTVRKTIGSSPASINIH